MAATVTGTLQVTTSFQTINTVGPASASSRDAITHPESYTNGSGAGQVNKVYSASLTFTGTQSIDLSGSLVDALGNAVVFTKVKSVVIEVTTQSAGQYLLVGGDANAFADWLAAANNKVKIGPGGVLAITSPVDGFTVTAATGDILKLDAGANTLTVNIEITGS